MLNVIAIMGRLVADPELRHTPQGASVTSFTVAVDRNFARQGEQRQADFIDVVVWRQTAEFVCKYFRKGSMIAVDGSLQTRTYQDRNGSSRKACEIMAANVSFAGGRDNTRPASETHQSAPQAAPVQAYGQGSVDDFALIDDNEDLPF